MPKLTIRATNYGRTNVWTGSLISHLKMKKKLKNYLAKFKIDRTILTFLNKRSQLSVTNRRTDVPILIKEYVSLLMIK